MQPRLPALALSQTEFGDEVPVYIKAPKRLRLPVFSLGNVTVDAVTEAREKRAGTASLSTNTVKSKASSRKAERPTSKQAQKPLRVFKSVVEFLEDLTDSSKYLRKNEIHYMKRHVGVTLDEIEKLESDIQGLCNHESKDLWKKSSEVFVSISSTTSHPNEAEEMESGRNSPGTGRHSPFTGHSSPGTGGRNSPGLNAKGKSSSGKADNSNISLFMAVKPQYKLRKGSKSAAYEAGGAPTETTTGAGDSGLRSSKMLGGGTGSSVAEAAMATAHLDELGGLMESHNQPPEMLDLYASLMEAGPSVRGDSGTNKRKYKGGGEGGPAMRSQSGGTQLPQIGTGRMQRTGASILGSSADLGPSSHSNTIRGSTGGFSASSQFGNTGGGVSKSGTFGSMMSMSMSMPTLMTNDTLGAGASQYLNVLGADASSTRIVSGAAKKKQTTGAHGRNGKKKKAELLSVTGKVTPISSINGADALRSELLKSLRNMQQSSTVVKQGIVEVQKSLHFNDRKVQSFVLTVAAEKLGALIHRLYVMRDLKRGWDAWVTMLMQDKQLDSMRRYVRFQGYRYFARYLVTKTLKRMQSRFTLWVSFTVAETNRLRREQELEAAQNIQRYFRGYLGRIKASSARERKQYQAMYESTIVLQKMFRGKIHRWRYLKHLRKKLELKCAFLMQRVVRGHFGRMKTHDERLRRKRNRAAVKIQAQMRGALVRKRAAEMHLERLKNLAVVQIQSIIRGFIVRKSVEKRALAFYMDKCATKIQKRIRGYLCRSNIDRRRAQLIKHRQHINKCATQIQAAYRGYRARIMVKMKLITVNRQKRIEGKASTQITRIVRGFLARCLLETLRKELYQKWLADARAVKEFWSEDSNAWFYLHEVTGDAAWEPPLTGYTKSDGMLVLADGSLIDDPAEDEDEIDEEENEEKRRQRFCVECSDRVAIRLCNECGDRFCTKCYKDTHAIGSRRTHTWEAIGPLDCTECEMELAERWCVACDEAFCDMCWRKVHGHGNRRYHPFSEVAPDGKINPNITTMEGEEVVDYQPTYAMQKNLESMASQGGGGGYEGYDEYGATGGPGDGISTVGGDDVSGYGNTATATEGAYAEDPGGYYDESGNWIATEGGGGGEAAEWTQAYDEEGNPYWYNNYTGVSQYEDPNAGY